MQTPIAQLSTLRRKAEMAIILLQTKRITEHGQQGEIEEAINVFNQMPRKNQVTWNAMLSALLDVGHFDSACQLFDKMPRKNPASYTSMITSLSKLGSAMRARQLFDSVFLSKHNVFSWTAMISCYVRNDKPMHALNLFRHHYGKFFELGIVPNSHTFSILLKACGLIRCIVMARQIHGLLLKLWDGGLEELIFVQNSLIDVYAKWGNLVDAEGLFNGMKHKDLATLNTMMGAYTFHLLMDKALGIFRNMERTDVLSWNIVMLGLLECRRGEEAIRLFVCLMRSHEETKPNSSTYTIVLSSCAVLAMIEFGRQVHALAVKNSFYSSNTYVSNSMIAMYASSGFTEELERVFDEMYFKDVISWNSVIQALGRNGCARKALEIAGLALNSNNYNHNTFIAILTSCSHGGFVAEGLEYFNSMGGRYGIEPSSDHRVCVIDMLGRTGKLDEALEFLRESGLESNSIAWVTMLNACFIHANSEIGEIAAERLQVLEPNNAGSYLALASVYYRTGRIEESMSVLDLMRSKDLKRDPRYSWVIEI